MKILPKNQMTSTNKMTKISDEPYCIIFDLYFNVITINVPFLNLLKSNNFFNNHANRKTIDYRNAQLCKLFMNIFQHAKEGISIEQEILIKDVKGVVYSLNFKASPTYDLENKMVGIVCIGNNIDKLKSQLQKLQDQKQLLKEIANAYSHELRHPLTNILAIISLVKQDDLKISTLYLECLETASKQMDKVINKVALQLYKAAQLKV